jgi:hypothetical protein
MPRHQSLEPIFFYSCKSLVISSWLYVQINVNYWAPGSSWQHIRVIFKVRYPWPCSAYDLSDEVCFYSATSQKVKFRKFRCTDWPCAGVDGYQPFFVYVHSSGNNFSTECGYTEFLFARSCGTKHVLGLSLGHAWQYPPPVKFSPIRFTYIILQFDRHAS